jgi:hypothetical protein
MAGSTAGDARVMVGDGAASLTVDNAGGGQNGVVVTSSETTITGGTGTTHLTVNDSGVNITGTGPSNGDLNVAGNANVGGDVAVGGAATFDGPVTVRDSLTVRGKTSIDLGGNRVQGVGIAQDRYDAVNLLQMNSMRDDLRDEYRRGIAIASAMDVVLPDPGKQFRVNVGGGYFNGQTAIGMTGSGRVNDDVALYFGIGSDTGFNETVGKVGVSYQW